MKFENDLITLFGEQAVGVYETDMFATSAAEIPILPSGEPTLNVTVSGGSSPVRVQNNVMRPGYLLPSGAVTCRAGSYDQAFDMAQAAYDACTSVHNRLIGSGWYLWIRPVQSVPFDFGHEPGSGQPRVRFTVNAYMKRRD